MRSDSYPTLGDKEYETQISKHYPFFSSFIPDIRYEKKKHTTENNLLWDPCSLKFSLATWRHIFAFML